MGSLFICPRCGNDDPRSTGFIDGRPYCRRCIAFNGSEAPLADGSGEATLDIPYELSREQRQLSDEVVAAVRGGAHVLIHAVTGAGKTEIVYQLMQTTVHVGGRVGFAIPRRDVVIELHKRLQAAFPRLQVRAVYGGHHEHLTGDIVILTTHQLYRYERYFDVLVIDEFDAFPFAGNAVLEAFVTRSLNGGRLVALTATPTPDMIARFSQPRHRILRLWTRYHGHPLPVPRLIRRPWLWRLGYLIDTINRHRKMHYPVLVFVPTIAAGRQLFAFIHNFCPGGANVNSKEERRAAIVTAFRDGTYAYLVSTSILERGVTLPHLQVVIYDAEHPLYDSGALIQMAGRVGRRKEAPDGEVIFLGKRRTAAISDAIAQIEAANRHMQSLS